MKIGYQTTEEFDQRISEVFPRRVHMLFPRDDEGIWDITCDWDLKNPIACRNSLLAAFPLVGSIMGLTKLFSVWSVNLREDSVKKIFVYTITGLMEFCGLGIVTLALKLFYTFALYCCNCSKPNSRNLPAPHIAESDYN
ncbi:hypothetical protein [Chlamydia psittaci]|uniref:hypothetical protein n=1 Tax=Chlamydia psittaci TaxID=83554 RepID=UPI00027E1288|nr:hypothetical protein [Chlamydia psittaci]AFS24443.1 hypothetical protein B602_0222 [Chlamydia psittaci M56]